MDKVPDHYFTIHTNEVEPDSDGRPTCRIGLAGSFDIGSRLELRAALLAAAETGARIVVDLNRVRFIDSEALSALIAGYLAAERAAVSFRLTGAIGIVKRVITVIGLDHLMETPA
ncbi:STAS domain-containing protein [Actinoplanes sp. HUAS TT8]|uniref:STAS domain-containing protein n=1 Tax=Actinoplanes sp. HUAS TT8 TaxID=3447453 RepID=UPI003F526193